MAGFAQWRARRHRRLYWSGVVIAVGALVGGAVVAYNGYQATAGPDGAVKGYFAALQHGDAAAALGFGDIPAGNRALLTREVLREQLRIAPIQDVRIAIVDRSGNHATANIRYRLDFASGGQQVADTATVVKRNGSWRLASSAISTQIRLLEASDRATIIGGTVPGDPVLMFPGAVPVRFDSPYLQLSQATSNVALNAPPVNDLTVEVTPQARAAVAAALAAAFAPCLVGSPAADPRCPMPSPRAVPGSLRGTLLAWSRLGITMNVVESAAGLINVFAVARIRGSYQLLDFNNIAATQMGSQTAPLSVPVRASAYAVAPLRLTWAGDQP